jgi:hypothetical protein
MLPRATGYPDLTCPPHRILRQRLQQWALCSQSASALSRGSCRTRGSHSWHRSRSSRSCPTAYQTCPCEPNNVTATPRRTLKAGGVRARARARARAAAHLLKNALSHAVLSVNWTVMPSSSILVCFHDSVPYLKYPPWYPTAARAPPRSCGRERAPPCAVHQRGYTSGVPAPQGGRQTLLADEHDQQQQQPARRAPAGPQHHRPTAGVCVAASALPSHHVAPVRSAVCAAQKYK